jgi:hypothetical protein
LCKRLWLKGVATQNATSAPLKAVFSRIHSLFGARQVHFRGTSKPITPFGGLISLVEFFGKSRLTDTIQDFMPFRLSSPNPTSPGYSILSLSKTFWGVFSGDATRFAQRVSWKKRGSKPSLESF